MAVYACMGAGTKAGGCGACCEDGVVVWEVGRRGGGNLLEEGGVVLLLHLAHADLEDGLLLGRQALLHVRLQPPQQEGPQHLRHARTPPVTTTSLILADSGCNQGVARRGQTPDKACNINIPSRVVQVRQA